MERYAAQFTFKDTSVRRQIGCGEGQEGLYGSLTFLSQLKLTWELMAGGDMPRSPATWQPGQEPVVLDFGAGTGRPMVLWQSLNLVHRAIGYEFDQVKVGKSLPYMLRLITRVRFESGLPIRTDPPTLLLQDVAKLRPADVSPLRPTLGYSFCAGMPPEAKKAMGDILRGCASMKVLVLVDYGHEAPLQVLTRLVDRGEQPLDHFDFRTMTGLQAMGRKGSYRALIVRRKSHQQAPVHLTDEEEAGEQ
ncbi:hypothetical protein PLESTF_001603300 [Pleodorina starrii]|nr:hypothetical protein PLESTF_001603300 [Pleodorina starrii]